ncbi:MAG: MFS transporter [Acidobacteriota bacterium]
MMPTSSPPTGKRGGRPTLPRSVWLVSWTSFFTDTASEAVYPLMPLYLTRVLGGTALSIGMIEGLAEALNSVLKIVSGRLADRWGTRKLLMIAGYALSSAVRPLVALASSWPHVLMVRLADRVGKGLRGAPRDALIAAWADPAIRGYAFGVNRAMDHAGAVVGPVLATVFLWFFPEQYRLLFALTIVPGIVAVVMLVPVPDVAPLAPVPDVAPLALVPDVVPPQRPGVERRQPLGTPFYRYLGVLMIFSLGNSTDAFLLLRLNEMGVGAMWIPLTWAALHVVKAVASPIGGRLSDRVNRKAIVILGWLIYAGVYAGFAAAASLPILIGVFLTYGLYYGLTEGVEKAMVADLVPAAVRGSAFGVHGAVMGIGALCASLLFGGIWKLAGAPVAFLTGAALALVSALLMAALSLPSPVEGT